jgi:ATP-dependent helicase/nuclease subunit B
MDHPRALPPEIQKALAQGRIILTANQRAARTLRRAFDLDQRALGHANWQPPPILAWDTWLTGLWRSLLLEGHATDMLLNASQEHTLWRAVIAADPATSSLRPLDALALTAAEAWLLLHTYRGADRLQRYPGNSDTRVFARWAAEFERRCIRSRYLTQAQLAETLRGSIVSGNAPNPPGILLIGFDATTPAQTALLDALRNAGSIVEESPPAAKAASAALAAAGTEHDELAACARWVRVRLTDKPEARLAVIVPAIETSRAEIDRVFRQVLAPELEDINAPVTSGPYEFSLGVPLATTPMVSAALSILRWTVNALSLERVSALLLSPYFATDASEHLARAEFDAFDLRQRHLLQPQLSLASLFAFASQSKQRPGLSSLLKHLQDLRPFANQREFTPVERTYADWAAMIHEILVAAGWAVTAVLDSVEFQTRRKWESSLDELATLDFDNVRVTFPDALAALERITAETLFAPESRHAPLQIMGPLESAGSLFDAIWFLRANDITWPARPSPNPLLPWQLQRDLSMPGANPALDAERARDITERIASSAPSIIFSYARESVDGPQRPSPALSTLDLENRGTSDIVPAGSPTLPIPVEIVVDDTPIPLPPDTVLPGGAAILQSQAACAFRAFAEKRLFASAPEAIDLGLDAAERGSLVHDVLERFWEQVQTQDALIKMSPIERTSMLSGAIDAALARPTHNIEPGWSSAYFAGERRRLLKLLGQWLNYELTRSPFIVRSREEMLNNVSIGPLHISVRVDRVDTFLENGEAAGDVILDYKTGSAKPTDWNGDRPDAPQLPLYAVVSESPRLAGIAFASIRPGNQMGIEGYQSQARVLPKAAKLKTDTLEAQVEQWRVVLERLAEAYHSGDARVSPKQYPSTCRYCQQRLLCRLDLNTLAPDANEDFIDENDPVVNTTDPPREVELD